MFIIKDMEYKTSARLGGTDLSPATQEAKTERSQVQGQPGQLSETPISK